MYSEYVKILCAEKSAMSLSKSKSNIVQPLLEETSFLDILSPSFTIRKYCVENNITSIPVCETCGGHTSINSKDHKLGFNRFCSDQCRQVAPKLDKSVLEKLMDKDWLTYQRIDLQKSKEIIAEELGISVTPVNKWLQYHNILDVQYNKSNQSILKYLNDKEWLIQKYINENLTCEQIATEIGSSKSTVSIKLNEFGIQISAPNSYDRPFAKISKGHAEILQFLDDYGVEYLINNRSILNGLELDIVIPNKHLAIEYGSVYTHKYRPHEQTFSTRKDKTYHITKANKCAENGISLFHIWEHDWKYKTDLIKSMLLHKLGLTTVKIYARKCIIKEVPIHIKNVFLDENHIQGRDKSLLKFGLYYNGELVSLMTVSKSRYNKKFQWEITRFCSKINTNVIGAFSKLFKFVITNYSGNIITYADRFHSEGNLYEKNGMKYLYSTQPSYRYAAKNSEIMMHRMGFQKKLLIKNGMTNNKNLTELEIMLDNDYSIVYDCGHKCYGYFSQA